MAGLGALIWGVLVGGSAVGAAIENADMMSKPYRYLEDGTPVYLDRKCNEHINGEKIVHKAGRDINGSVKILDVGERSGKVYFDPEENTKNRMNVKSEQRKKEAIEQGMLAYAKYDHRIRRSITCEISTGRYIAALRKDYGKGYRKYYLNNPNFDYYDCHCKDKDDEGIEITKEEFNKLDIVGGSHITI